MRCPKSDAMHPYYGKENSSMPTGVEVREGLDRRNGCREDIAIYKARRHIQQITGLLALMNQSESICNPQHVIFPTIYWICCPLIYYKEGLSLSKMT